MIRFFLSIFFVTTTFWGWAQQNTILTQNTFFQSPYNPASAGLEDGYRVSFSHLNQWTGVSSSPRTYLFNFEGNILHKSVGIGLNLSQNTFKTNSNTSLNGQANYKIRAFNGALSFGLEFTFNQNRIDWTKLDIEHEDDELLSSTSFNDFNIGTGLFYQGKKINLGASLKKIRSPELFLYGSFKHELNTNWNLLTSGLYSFRKNNINIHTLNLNNYLFYKSNYWIGISFNQVINTTLHGGLNLAHFIPSLIHPLELNYSYNINPNQWRELVGNSHEISLIFKFKPRPSLKGIQKKKVIKSPTSF